MSSYQKPHLHQDWIDTHAFGIVRALQRGGFETYLVGGCVRDLLLGIHPKDYDIATTAKPNEVRRIVFNSYVIGKRFRLVLVKRDQQQYEVATFRRAAGPEDVDESGEQPMGDNLFGTAEEDAKRRDFTINALFYDPIKNELIDYAEGKPDLEAGLLRMIGEPNARLREDPIRILRAIRLAHKIGFSLAPDLRAAVRANASTLLESKLPRRREEYLKFLRLSDPSVAFMDAFDLGVLAPVAPTLAAAIEHPERGEEFLCRLRNFSHEGWGDEPVGLFAGLLHAYIRCFLEPDPHQPLRANAILEHPVLAPFMRLELGMSKAEMGQVAKALQLETLLVRRRDFEKRGLRRQMAVLSNEAFELAMKYAERDLLLSGTDRLFWLSQFEKAAVEISAVRDGERSRRRRRPRRRKRPTSGSSPAQVQGLDDSSDTNVG